MSENSIKISENYIENEKIGKLIMKFSIPCVLSMVVNALYSTVDQIFIGQGVGYIGNAATNVTFPFVVLALGFSLLLGDGAAAFYRIKVATFVSVIGFIIFQFFPQSIINLFGQNDALYNEFALKSFKIFLSLCMFIGFKLTTCVFFQAIGKPVKDLCKQTFFIIPLMIILPKFFGVLGVLYAGPCAEILSVVVTIIFITSELKTYSKFVDIKCFIKNIFRRIVF